MKVPSPCLMRWEPNISTPSALSTQYLVLALSSTFAGIPSIFFEKSVNFAPPQLRFPGSQKSSSASLFRALKSCKKNRLNQKKSPQKSGCFRFVQERWESRDPKRRPRLNPTRQPRSDRPRSGQPRCRASVPCLNAIFNPPRFTPRSRSLDHS